ncbi:hypothetical protein Tco_0744161 [Tanacetum coccineum]
MQKAKIELNLKCIQNNAEVKRMQNIPYAPVVGSIIYVVRCTRPDVAFAHNITSRFQQNLDVVDWKSTKQSIFTTSSAEAKYIVAYDASKEVVWIRISIFGLGVVPTIEEPITMYYDNTGAITIANESATTKGARHYRAKVHYLHEVIELGDIKLEKVYTYDNLADPFTKALPLAKHSEHTQNIGMLPASSLILWQCVAKYATPTPKWELLESGSRIRMLYDQKYVEFKRIFLTGFRSCTSHSRYREASQSRQHAAKPCQGGSFEFYLITGKLFILINGETWVFLTSRLQRLVHDESNSSPNASILKD